MQLYFMDFTIKNGDKGVILEGYNMSNGVICFDITRVMGAK